MSSKFAPPPPLDAVPKERLSDEQAAMAEVLSHLQPKSPEDVKLVAAALKTHGTKFEDLFYAWAKSYGRYKAKGLWAKARPDPDAMEEVIDRQIAAIETKNPFEPLTGDALKELDPIAWAVKSVFPATGLVSIYGPSGSGKSFAAQDLGIAVSEGLPWFGYKTKKRPVLYVVLEGAAGVPARVRAWECNNGRPIPSNFAFLTQPFNLVVEQDVRNLAAVCPQGCVIFIDTLNRATPGFDENSGKDMGLFIAKADLLQRLTNGLVVLIAHTGKDAERGLRGHSSLFAALDGGIVVKRSEYGRSFSVGKAKDGEDGNEHEFRLEVVTVGTDEDGDNITSCVVIPKSAEHAGPRTTNLSPRMKHRFAMTTFLVLLNKFTLQGRPVVETKAHIVFSNHPESGGVTAEAFKMAKELLLGEGVIEVIKDPHQSPSKARNVLREKPRDA